MDRLVLRGLRKIYDESTALDLSPSDDMVFGAGKIYAIAGENGAGKSTLVKIISGLIKPNAGHMVLEGQRYAPGSVNQARTMGVEIVLQEPGLAPTLSVAENIFLGRENYYSRFKVLSRRQLTKIATEALTRVNVHVDPDILVRDINVETQKLIELARATLNPPRILIIDEMTASLTRMGVERLFGILREASGHGTTILFVSHYLDEVFKLCDEVVILKDGQHIDTVPITKLDEEELQILMVGRSLIGELYHKESAITPTEEVGAAVLSIENLHVAHAPDPIALTIRRGEIVGLGGLVGCGSDEILRTLYGLQHDTEAGIRLLGEPYTPTNPRHAIELGIGFVSEDRDKNDLLLMSPIQENIVLPTLPHRTRWGLTSRKADAAISRQMIDMLSIVCRGPNDYPANLSGGNRQKVVFGKWLIGNLKLLLLHNPTRGVDVGAKAKIYQALRQIAANGTAILMASNELNELRGMCDTIVIMKAGVITGRYSGASQPSEAELLAGMV